MKKILSFLFICLLASIGSICLVKTFMTLLIGLPHSEWNVFARILTSVFVLIIYGFALKIIHKIRL